MRAYTKPEDHQDVKNALNNMNPILYNYVLPQSIHNSLPDPKYLLKMRGLKSASLTLSQEALN